MTQGSSLHGIQLLLLAGRERWVPVCGAEFASCPTCREALATFLAREMDWNVRRALDRDAAVYAAEVNGAPEDGRELRRLTVLCCYRMQPPAAPEDRFRPELVVVDEICFVALQGTAPIGGAV